MLLHATRRLQQPAPAPTETGLNRDAITRNINAESQAADELDEDPVAGKSELQGRANPLTWNAEKAPRDLRNGLRQPGKRP